MDDDYSSNVIEDVFRLRHIVQGRNDEVDNVYYVDAIHAIDVRMKGNCNVAYFVLRIKKVKIRRNYDMDYFVHLPLDFAVVYVNNVCSNPYS